MKFIIDYNRNPQDKTLIYRKDEYSFDMSPWGHIMDIELVLNKLTFSVVDNMITQLSGFCGLPDEDDLTLKLPSYRMGSLLINHDFEHGFAYGMHEGEFPVKVNRSMGLVCIGDPSQLSEGVEFISGCIAIIDEQGLLSALWLKPARWI